MTLRPYPDLELFFRRGGRRPSKRGAQALRPYPDLELFFLP